MKRMISLALCSLSLAAFAGRTYTWTGAQDSRWTNPANWTVDGAVATACPGVVSNEVNGVFAPAPPSSDTAVFDSAGSARTTVDLEGLYSVAHVRVSGAAAPKYTFGTGITQTLPLETNGSFVVEGSVKAENCPLINANLAFPANVDSAWWSGANIGTQLTYANDTAGTLTLNGTFNTKTIWFRPDAMSTVYRELDVSVRAPNGTLAFRGDQCANRYIVSYGYTVSRIELLGGCQFTGGKQNNWRQSVDVYVGEGATFGYMPQNNAGHILHGNVELRAIGPGDFQFAANGDGQSFDNHAYIDLGDGRRIDAATRTSSFNRAGQSATQLAPNAIYFKTKSQYSAVLRLNVAEPGDYAEGFYASGHFALEVPSVRQLARCGALWLCATNKFYNKSAWRDWGFNYAYFKTRWTGDAPEAFTTPVTNYNYATPQVFTLENSGSAALTAGMPYFTGGERTSLALAGTTAPIIYGVGMVGGTASVELSGDVVFTNGVDLAGISALVLSNATLSAEGSSALAALPEICVSQGANVLAFEDGDLALSNLRRTGGTLDIRSKTGKTLMLPQFDGEDVSWLTYGGNAVEVESGGRIVAVSKYAHDVEIAARGGEVPNAADSVVGITSDGTGDNDRLSADAVAVKGLVHKAEASSTIALDAGQSLAAGFVARSAMAGGLTLGNVDGQGAVAPTEAGLLFDNESVVRPVKVRAALSSPSAKVTVNGRGETVFRGGTKPGETAKELRVTDGTAVFAGGTYDLARFLVATSRADAVSTAIISNSTVNLHAGSGVSAGGVGGLYGTDPADRIGGVGGGVNRLVLAGGGTLALADKTGIGGNFYDRTFFVGLNGTGVLEVEDGGVFEGRLQIGGCAESQGDGVCTSGIGSVRQRGGTVTAYGIDYNRYPGSSGIGGYGDWYGRNAGSYALSGGSFFARGCFTVGFYDVGGVFDQTGGYSAFSNVTASATGSGGTLLLGATNGGSGAVRVKDSKMDIYGQISMCQSYSGPARSDLIVDGESAEIDMHDKDCIYMIPNKPGADKLTQATASCINGGTLAMSCFNCGNKEQLSEVHHAVVNLDRGTLRTTVSGRDLVVDAVPEKPTFRAFLVGPGGATVDTDGKTGNRSAAPFAAPVTGVVTGVVDFSSFKCEGVHPRVEVLGDGYGAVAFAEYDGDRQMVTNVTIVAGGTGYTQAKVSVKRGKASIREFDATIGTPVSGPFAKQGDGDFTFTAANTYGGDTILRGGVLRLGAEGALPQGTTLVYEGGSLETAAAFCPGALKVRVPNVDGTRKVNVITFTDSVPETIPDVEIVNGEPAKWISRVSGSTLKVLKVSGTQIVIR